MTRVIDFLAEVKVELAKVIWPGQAQVVKLTVMVIVVTLIVGFFLFLVDTALTKGLELLLVI